jgi:hypothetical protein
METPESPRMSFFEKLTNFFAAPGDLFDEIRTTPNTPSNWIIPMISFIIIAIVMNQLILQNPSLAHQTAQVAGREIEKAVQEGRMSEQQAEQAFAFTKPGSVMFMLTQVVGIAVISPLILFLMALVYWLLGRWGMNASAPYMKVVEVVGFTFLVGATESIVTTILMTALDSIYATPSLALAVLQNFQPEDKLHMVLAKVNVFTFWDLGISSFALARLFQRDFPKVLVLVVALWLLWSVFQILTGIRLT